MMVLFHDKYERTHDSFLKKLQEVPGKHIVVHVNNFAEAKEALDAYEFDLVSIDDLEGGFDIIKEILSWREVDFPKVFHFHTVNWQAANEQSKQIPQHIPAWIHGIHDIRMLDKLRELEKEVAKNTPQEDED